MPVICFSVAYLFVNDSLINKTGGFPRKIVSYTNCYIEFASVWYIRNHVKRSVLILPKKLELKFQQQKTKKAKCLVLNSIPKFVRSRIKTFRKRKKQKQNLTIITMMASLRSDSIVFKQMITHLIGTSYEVWQWYRLKVCHT